LGKPVISIETIQNIVEMVLQQAGHLQAAKNYILYRDRHNRLRQARPIPQDVKTAFSEAAVYFPTQLTQFQFFDKYSRFDYARGRRESWIETVDRTVSFLHELAGERVDASVYERIRRGILELKVMPSMRMLAMAGEAARRSNITIYNCAFEHVDSIDAFVEALIISMSGCGVGYSVEREFVEQLPRIKRQANGPVGFLAVEDSAEGWAEALRMGLETWFNGEDIKFDLSGLRPAGSPLRIKGGRASGPEPLRAMLEFIRNRVLSRQGSFLRPLDAHDIMCIVGNAAVSGGMRRTAMLSLFDYDDTEMLNCKSGDFERENNQRWNANNSAVWPEGGLTELQIARQVLTMFESERGEPGIFNRQAAHLLMPARRGRVDDEGRLIKWGVNPCGEVLLRGQEFCNLSAAVARQYDTYETLKEKVELATIIGTIQATATNFPGLRPQWKKNCEE
jgi:ribonucleoside-triphosphate reductase